MSASDSKIIQKVKPNATPKNVTLSLLLVWGVTALLSFLSFHYSLLEALELRLADLLFHLIQAQTQPDSFDKSPIVIITLGDDTLFGQKKPGKDLQRQHFVELLHILEYTKANVFDYFFTDPVSIAPESDDIEKRISPQKELLEQGIGKLFEILQQENVESAFLENWANTFYQKSVSQLQSFYELAQLSADFELGKISKKHKNCIYASNLGDYRKTLHTELVRIYLLPLLKQIFEKHGKDIGYEFGQLHWPQSPEDYQGFLSYVGKTFSNKEGFFSALAQQKNFIRWQEWLENLENLELLNKTLENHWDHYASQATSNSSSEVKNASQIAFDFNKALYEILTELYAQKLWLDFSSSSSSEHAFEYANKRLQSDLKDQTLHLSEYNDIERWLSLNQYRSLMKPAKRSWRRINIIPLIPPLFALADKGFPSVALTTREEDGIARYYPLVQRVWIQDDFYLISNLALSAYLKMNQLDTRDIVLKEHAIHIPLRDIHIPINSEGNAKILWKGAWKNVFPQKELIQILREYQEASDPEAYRKQWKGKICFIGETSIGSHDRRNTPFDKDYPMVGAHAHFMKQLLTQEFIREAGFQENLGFLTIFMLLALLGLLWDSWKINIFSLCLLALFIPATFIFFYIYFHTLYIVTYPLFALSLLSLNTFLYRYITIGRSQRAIRYMFATMVSPEILSYMEKNPSAFSLKGESKEVSVLFSDIAGFTSISEKMHPSTLVKLLNFYLTAMTDIIIKYNGYIDKYEGDAIMAVWGVPINSSSHALDCCLSALEQLKALGELQKELTKQFGVEIQIRIGINTGIVSAGCMGSEKKKMSYTIIGDVVNLGSRLESANKNYQTQILIGQNTYQSIQNHLIARPLDRLIVVGKTEPVTVYELLGKRGEVEEEAPLLFAQALQLYWEKKWDQAQETFEQYLQKHPQDTVTPLYLERIAYYRLHPPEEGWKGEFRMLFK